MLPNKIHSSPLRYPSVRLLVATARLRDAACALDGWTLFNCLPGARSASHHACLVVIFRRLKYRRVCFVVIHSQRSWQACVALRSITLCQSKFDDAMSKPVQPFLAKVTSPSSSGLERLLFLPCILLRGPSLRSTCSRALTSTRPPRRPVNQSYGAYPSSPFLVRPLLCPPSKVPVYAQYSWHWSNALIGVPCGPLIR